ncbi:hypothetical protein RU97_GL001735 [Enterococcus canis]|uniref:Uncharacterized protein n=1 Tax=Enterococcus canis TaxID=214095 RepID=A0A1L8REZ8_9ENTE|nr:hypothetical protein [Enterococcus canis]OJG18338.1 hypothetical protein RU97_GL001735 [Enterococcus canis]
MDTFALIQDLKNSSESLLLFARGNQSSEETIQQFLFDLTDYAEGFSVVTQLMDEPAQPRPLTANELSNVLGEQRQRLDQLIPLLKEQLHTTEATETTFLKQNTGGLRRIISSLNGLVELNSLMLQDNRQFQQQVKQNPLEAPVKEVEKPKGFFGKLFGK